MLKLKLSVQGCIKFLIPTPGEGKVYQTYSGEYEVLKEGREYHGCGEEYSVYKREAEIIFPIILRLFERMEEGKGLKFWGGKSRFQNTGVGKNIKFKGTLYVIYISDRLSQLPVLFH